MPSHGSTECSQCKSRCNLTVRLDPKNDHRAIVTCGRCGHTWKSTSRWTLRHARKNVEKVLL